MNDVPQVGTKRITLTYLALGAAPRFWVLVCSVWTNEEPGAEQRLPIVAVRPAYGDMVARRSLGGAVTTLTASQRAADRPQSAAR